MRQAPQLRRILRVLRARRPFGSRGHGALAALLAVLILSAPAAAQSGSPADGRIIVEAMEYPWSAIGRVNAGGRGYCTGFLVGPRHAMTAAHCLYDFTEGRWRGANELHFVAGYQRDEFVIHSKVARYEVSDRFDPADRADPSATVHDWALLTLADPIGQVAGWLGLMALNDPADLDLRPPPDRPGRLPQRPGARHLGQPRLPGAATIRRWPRAGA